MRHSSLREIQSARLRAVEMFAEGKAVSDVARYLGYARQTVSRWHSAWEKHGAQGLSLGTPGPARRLSDEHLEQIQRILIEGPRAHGYATELWTLDRIADLAAKHTGVACSLSTIWRLLRRLNWSSQKPERRARERKEEEIARWKDEFWPVIKRGHKTTAQH